MLFVDNRNHREEDHQQRGKRQGFLERMTDAVFFDDAAKRGQQHDDHQAHHADRGDVKSERQDQDHADHGLYDQRGRHLVVALAFLFVVEFGQYLRNIV